MPRRFRLSLTAALVWIAVFVATLIGYQGMWERPWLRHSEFLTMAALTTTLVVGFGICASALLILPDRLPRLVGAGISAGATVVLFSASALALGTHRFDIYEWPGLSGLGIAFFGEYRMLIFITIPLPVAACANGILTFAWGRTNQHR